MLDRRDELDAFKREINLIEYAAASSYMLDRAASSRCSAVVVHPDGDKVIVAVGKDGHWTYFSIRDDQDNGTIIDFVQRRQGGTLGQVRKTLRAFRESVSTPLPFPARSWPELLPTSKDLVRIEAALAGMPTVTAHDYLEGARAIPRAVVSHERFNGRIRMDERRNAVFPHLREGMFCGFEVKNRGFTGFSTGGEKALWLSNGFETDNTLVIAESAIDALSHFAMRRPETFRYASIGGSMNQKQPVLIRREVEQLPSGALVVIATDNDPGGDALAATIREALDSMRVNITEDRPTSRGLDWNDVLHGQR